jgi:hypothetical protein
VDLFWVLAGGKSPWRAPYLFDEKRFLQCHVSGKSTTNSVPSNFGAKFPTLEAALSDRIEIEAINLGAGATLPRAPRWGIRTPTALLTDLRLSLKPSRGGYR